MSKLTVIVVGHQSTGKSTIACVIEAALRQHGFEVKHAGENGGPAEMPRYALQARLEALLERKTEISVREVSA